MGNSNTWKNSGWTANEFIRHCTMAGYGRGIKKLAKEYVAKNPKEFYDVDDSIAVYYMKDTPIGSRSLGTIRVHDEETSSCRWWSMDID